MAAVRKRYVRTKAKHQKIKHNEAGEKACFLEDLLDQTIQATTVITRKQGNGVFQGLDYDDPDGG